MKNVVGWTAVKGLRNYILRVNLTCVHFSFALSAKSQFHPSLFTFVTLKLLSPAVSRPCHDHIRILARRHRSDNFFLFRVNPVHCRRTRKTIRFCLVKTEIFRPREKEGASLRIRLTLARYWRKVKLDVIVFC